MLNGVHFNGMAGKFFQRNDLSDETVTNFLRSPGQAPQDIRESGISLPSPAQDLLLATQYGEYFKTADPYSQFKESLIRSIEESHDSNSYHQIVLMVVSRASNLPVLKLCDLEHLKKKIGKERLLDTAVAFAQMEALNYLHDKFGPLDANDYDTLVKKAKEMKSLVLESVDNKLCSSRHEDTFAQRLINSGEVPDGNPREVKDLWASHYDKVIERLGQLKTAASLRA